MIPVDQSQHRPEAVRTLLDCGATIRDYGGDPLEVLATAIRSYERGEYFIAILKTKYDAQKYVGGQRGVSR